MRVELHNPAARTVPTVQASYTADGARYKVICPHCFAVHVHGPQAGHRLAHCEPGTKGKEMGYFIEPPLEDQEEA